MTITIEKAHEAWIMEQVASGAFTSADEAVLAAIQRLMLDDGMGDVGLAQSMPLIVKD